MQIFAFSTKKVKPDVSTLHILSTSLMEHCHSAHPEPEVQIHATLAHMKQRGLKLTTPRQGVVRALAHASGPKTIEEISQALMDAGPGRATDLVTVYRIMHKLEEIGAAVRCDFADGSVRFELASGDHHHHRIVCRICKSSQPVAACEIDTGNILPIGHGYSDITHRLEFFGVCPTCKASAFDGK